MYWREIFVPVFGKHGLILCTHYDGSFFAGFHVENLQYLLYCCVFSVKTDKEISRRTARTGQAVLPLRNRRKTGGFWGCLKSQLFKQPRKFGGRESAEFAREFRFLPLFSSISGEKSRKNVAASRREITRRVVDKPAKRVF